MECPLSRLAGDSKLSWAWMGLREGMLFRGMLFRGNRPGKWAHENHMKFNKAKCKCINIQFVPCTKPSLLRRRVRKCHQVVTSVPILCTFPPGQSERFCWMATPVLAVGVEIFLSMANLCCLHFFTINLFIWCQNGCVPPVFFLPRCNLPRPHPHLSVLATGSVVVTGSATLWCPQCQL